MMYKIMLLGQPQTGKSSFRSYVCSGTNQKPKIPIQYYPSVGVQVGVKTIQFNDSEFINIQIWDTTGNHAYHSICQKFYKDMHGFIIFADLGQKSSLDAIEYWLKKIKDKRQIDDQHLFVGVIANKSDLNRKFSQKDFLINYQHSRVKLYKQISLKTGQNTNQVLLELGLQICNNKPNRIDKEFNQQNNSVGTCNCIIM